MSRLDPTDPEVWVLVRTTLRRALTTSFHCAIASCGPDGRAHVTPIGSIMLDGPGRATYFDVFNAELSRNLDLDPRVTVMAVDSGRRRWLCALLRGRFDNPPGFRLIGTVGPSRPATDAEQDRFHRRVRATLRTRGGRKLWGRDEGRRARDLTFTEVVPVSIPRMTTHLWPVRPAKSTGDGEPIRGRAKSG